ncbi:MAG TPA: TrkA C-terminal domain-containing protein [Solirubrobacteraceae bacterium]|nr:TrkA C-terminal domain-containing protein [Solirubrobacteraceae bacterium]
MLAAATVLLVALVSLLITRVATIALTLTGMARDAARFQARSALSGTGFTTTEAEAVVGHPVRRRIVMTLMLLGSAGLVTTIATLILTFASADRSEAFARLGVLIVALAGLLWLSRRAWVDRRLSALIARLLRRYTDLETADYARLLHIGGQWGVGEVAVREGDWLAGTTLGELRLRDEGVVALGLELPGGEYLGAPDFETVVRPGATLVLYGRAERLAELDDRPAGAAGQQAHEQAVAEARSSAKAERERAGT